MRKLAVSLFLVISAFVSFSISAKPILAEVKISELKNIKLTSYFLDQIYFNVLEIDNHDKTKSWRIPEYPLDTPIKKHTKLSNITLWKKELKDGESYQVIISVAEQDLSKFNPDDLIGQAAVTFSNDGNKLVSKWSVPASDRKHTTTLISEKDQSVLYEMKGDKGDYQVSFKR